MIGMDTVTPLHMGTGLDSAASVGMDAGPVSMHPCLNMQGSGDTDLQRCHIVSVLNEKFADLGRLNIQVACLIAHNSNVDILGTPMGTDFLSEHTAIKESLKMYIESRHLMKESRHLMARDEPRVAKGEPGMGKKEPGLDFPHLAAACHFQTYIKSEVKEDEEPAKGHDLASVGDEESVRYDDEDDDDGTDIDSNEIDNTDEPTNSNNEIIAAESQNTNEINEEVQDHNDAETEYGKLLREVLGSDSLMKAESEKEPELKKVSPSKNKHTSTNLDEQTESHAEQPVANSKKAKRKYKRKPKCRMCQICLKEFDTAQRLRIHILSHSEERQWKCDICGKAYKTKEYLQTHQSKFHLKNKWQCKICNMGFGRQGHWIRHKVEVHGEESPYKCDLCDLVLYDGDSFRIHKLRHTGEKKFGCDKCGAMFYMMSELNVHMKNHAETKDYVCDICYKAFRTKKKKVPTATLR